MTRQTLTLPPWQAPQNVVRGASAAQINRTATTTKQETTWGLADGEWLPFIYGRVSMGAIVPTVAKHPSGDLLLLCVFAGNPCTSIDKLYVGDKLWDGEVAIYLGNQTTPDTWLSEAINGYGDVLNGYTYAVLRFKDGKVPSLSSIRAIVRGQPIVGSYDNPAHCLAHFAQNHMGLAVEPTGLQQTAARCDERVGEEKRRTLSLVLSRRNSKADWLATLAEYAGCYYYIDNQTLHLIAKRPRDVSHTITPDDIVADSLSLSRLALSGVANKINISYTLPNDEGKAWSSNKISVELPDVPLSKQRESSLNMPGFTSASMAARYATERINEQNLCDLKVEFDCPNTKANTINVGEVISVTSGIGLSNKQFTVLSNVKQTINRAKITAIEYDAAVYSDAIVTEPSTADTALPEPRTVASITNLNVTEQLKVKKTGITFSHLEINFTGGTSHIHYDVEVFDKNSMSTPIWAVHATPIDSHVTATVAELKTYVVRVRGTNHFSFSSPWETVEIYTGGKLNPPSDVANIEGVELGGVVYLNWSVAYDMDLRDYVIKRMPVGAAWDSQFAKEANTVAALHDAVAQIPVGRWDFAVKARDWAGNLSVNEARCTVEVDDESAAMAGDIHDYNSLNVSNMVAIYNGFFDDPNKQRYVSSFGESLNTLFTQPFSHYPKKMAEYHQHGNSRVTTPVYDFGLQISGQWSGFSNVETLDGATTELMQISADNNRFTDYPPSAKTSGRYVKLQATSTGTMVATLPKWHVRATAKQRSETGKGKTLATGRKRMVLANRYYDYISVMVQPIGFGLTGGVEDVHLDPNGQNYIDIFVINTDNTPVAADFTFIFTGR